MATVQDIVFGEGSQTIYLDVPEGLPSAATVKVLRDEDTDDNDGLTAAVTGAVSIDSNNTTVDAASGASQTDPKVLNVTATTNFAVGRQFLVTTADGRTEWPVVAAITSAASVRTENPLFNDYVSTDTVVGTRVSQTIDTTWASDTGNLSDLGIADRYRARWIVTVGGQDYRHYTWFRLVRMVAGHSVRPADMEQFHPGWLATLPTSHADDRGRGLIDEAYDLLSVDMWQEGFDNDTFRHGDLINALTKYKARAQFMANKYLLGGDEDKAIWAENMYQAKFDSLIRQPGRAKIPVDNSQDGRGIAVRPVGITVL